MLHHLKVHLLPAEEAVEVAVDRHPNQQSQKKKLRNHLTGLKLLFSVSKKKLPDSIKWLVTAMTSG